MKAQRLRLTFARGDEARDLSHLEVIRALEQAMRQAQIPLAYSEGRRPTAQISVAAPLPQGVTSECELADVFLSERMEPTQFVAALRANMPAGMDALCCCEVGLALRALQTQVRWAEYEVEAPRGERTAEDVHGAIADLLAARTLPWEHRRETKVRRYDLRPLVLALRMETEGEGTYCLAMRLRIGRERSGRADQVIAALGLEPPLRIHRRRLYVDRIPPAVSAYRRWAERED
ncbi:MAG: TIGR03936 family radical SAM-associated protein [Dehalococcoidia bacterium]